jgi:transposase
MIIDLTRIRIFVKPGYTDLRKAINGLSVIVEGTMKHNPFHGDLFLFCNRDRRVLKALYWDRNGFCLWKKRLEKDHFPWPESEEAAREITYDQLTMVLDGIDFWKAYQRLSYESVG